MRVTELAEFIELARTVGVSRIEVILEDDGLACTRPLELGGVYVEEGGRFADEQVVGLVHAERGTDVSGVAVASYD